MGKSFPKIIPVHISIFFINSIILLKIDIWNITQINVMKI